MPDVPATLEKWLQQQRSEVVKKVTLKHVDNPPIHFGPDRISTFYPRVPPMRACGEDQTVPRVCCGMTLKNALIGGRHHLWNATRMYVYTFDERDIVVPSINLTKEPNRAAEAWIVPHRLSNWEIKPTVVGELRLATLSGDGNKALWLFRGNTPLQFDDKSKLEADKVYQIDIVGVGMLKEGIKISLRTEQVHVDTFFNAEHGYTVYQ